jgi:hypothetical protein
MKNTPTLKALHSDSSLIDLKLEMFRKLGTEELINSLKLDQSGCLKARPDGTMIDGHHRITVLRERGVDVDSLPRQVIVKK